MKECCRPDGGRIHDLLITSRTRIQLDDRGRHCMGKILSCVIFDPQCEKKYFQICTPNKDSNQSAYPYSLIRVSVVLIKTLYILGCPKCTQSRFCSDCANIQADLCWAHMSEGTFSVFPDHIMKTRLFKHSEYRKFPLQKLETFR